MTDLTSRPFRLISAVTYSLVATIGIALSLVSIVISGIWSTVYFILLTNGARGVRIGMFILPQFIVYISFVSGVSIVCCFSSS